MCQTSGVVIWVFMSNIYCKNLCPIINGYIAKSILIFHDKLTMLYGVCSHEPPFGLLATLTIATPCNTYSVLSVCLAYAVTRSHATWILVVGAHEGHGPLAKIAGNRILASNHAVRWLHKGKWWSYQNGNSLSLRRAELCIQISWICFERSSE